MKAYFLVMVVGVAACCSRAVWAAKLKKNANKTTTEDTAVASPAIIAIEIVDPNENATGTKNSKRTIDGSLGYGYNSYDGGSKPRYEVYKYSQHDIPPYKGDPTALFTPSSAQVNVQKSVQYTLPSVTQYGPPQEAAAALKPGTTLYSSVDAHGQIGGLTSSLAQIDGLKNKHSPVPVIVLRIYPDQLKDSTIQANLPSTHPFAKVVNSVNIQSLLEHYIEALRKPAVTTEGYRYDPPTVSNYYPEETYHRQPSTYQPPVQDYHQQYQYHQQASYPEQHHYQQQQQQQPQQQYRYNEDVQVQQAPVKYQFTTSKQYVPPVVEASPKPQYYYVQPSTETSHYAQYRPDRPQQYPDYYPVQQQQQQQTSDQLLTAENYPSPQHTRVIFKTTTGNVRAEQREEEEQTVPAEEVVKTIKVQVPENVANVEVQEEYRTPYQQHQQAYPATEEEDYSQSKYFVTENAYKEGASSPQYDYKNTDYELMLRYLSRRGAMPAYFFQDPEEEGDQKALAESYEEVAFPSTTTASTPSKKKTKNKKRT